MIEISPAICARSNSTASLKLVKLWRRRGGDDEGDRCALPLLLKLLVVKLWRLERNGGVVERLDSSPGELGRSGLAPLGEGDVANDMVIGMV